MTGQPRASHGPTGVFAASPDRIFIAQRGEARLPQPVPPGFAGFAGSIGLNVLTADAARTWQNCLYTVDGNGNVRERWTQWDRLCEGSSGPGPHRVRISPYDPEQRVWVVNETFHTIYVFSNDGKQLLLTLGEKHVPGTDATHFGRPQDVAGQFNGVHAVAVGPNGMIFGLDRSGGRINVFRTTSDPAKMQHVDTWPGFGLPLDLIANDDSLWRPDADPALIIRPSWRHK